MLTLSMKKSLEQGLNDVPSGSEINYYGTSHLRLVYKDSIVGVVSLNKTSLKEIEDYLVDQGFKLGQEVDSSVVKPLPNGNNFGWK